MAKKEKKQLTPTEKKKQYKALANTCFAGEFVSIFTPFFVIGIVNYEKYFIEYNGTKMSISAILAAILMGLAIWLISKKKLTANYATIIIGWAFMTLIFFLLGEIITDIAYIMLFGLIGILGAQGLDIASAKLNEQAEKIQKGIEKAEEELTAEAYKLEKEEREIKKGDKKKVRF